MSVVLLAKAQVEEMLIESTVGMVVESNTVVLMAKMDKNKMMDVMSQMKRPKVEFVESDTEQRKCWEMVPWIVSFALNISVV